MKGKVFTQKEMMDVLIPKLKSSGVLYKKTKEVMARKALKGEQINTVTSDGLETTNTATEGDFIIKNQTEAGEMYIVGATKFNNRYDFLKKEEGGFSQYKAKGKVIGIEMTLSFLNKIRFNNVFSFIAPWNEEMIVKENDFLVCPPDFSEIYRIARKEFFETYQLD